MRKILLVFLAVLFIAPMLSGCFCPYWIDGHGRGDGYGRGHNENRGYDSPRDGSRDHRGHR